MSEGLLKVKDLRTRQAEYLTNQLKADRASLINSKRILITKSTTDNSEEARGAAFFQNVPEKEAIEAIIATTANATPEPQNLRKFILDLRDKNLEVATKAIVSIRILSTSGYVNFAEEFLGYDGLTPLFEIMQNFMFPHLQAEGAWIISNLSAGPSDDAHTMLNKGVVALLHRMLNCPFEEVINHVLFVVGNISADCPFCRSHISTSGILNDIQGLPLRFNSRKINNKITWIISNVLRLQPESEPYTSTTAALITKLIDEFVKNTDFEVQTDCIFGLTKHANLKAAELLMREDFLLKFRQFHEDLLGQKVQSNVGIISAIHEIISGLSLCQNNYILEMIKFGFLRNLHIALCSQRMAFIVDSLVILSNFVVGNDSQVSAVLAEPGLVDKILTLIHSKKDAQIQKNAIWVICNMCATSSLENVQNLMGRGVMEIFDERLKMDENPVILINIIEALGRLAEFFERASPTGKNQLVEMILENGIAGKLEDLQSHKSENVYSKVLAFMEKYFECE